MHKKILLNFFFLLSFLITNPLIAEDVLQEDTIANIIIKGNERVSDDTVLTYANISKGDRITPELLKNVIKRLYQTNYFDDISVTQNFNDLIRLFICSLKNKIFGGLPITLIVVNMP